MCLSVFFKNKITLSCCDLWCGLIVHPHLDLLKNGVGSVFWFCWDKGIILRAFSNAWNSEITNLCGIQFLDPLEQIRFHVGSRVQLLVNAVEYDIKWSWQNSSVLSCTLNGVRFARICHTVCEHQPLMKGKWARLTSLSKMEDNSTSADPLKPG